MENKMHKRPREYQRTTRRGLNIAEIEAKKEASILTKEEAEKALRELEQRKKNRFIEPQVRL
ncbi:hypothetical protein [Vibrio parahaemolyticus]|uniref:hypothetical protein n=1 Tax=Vibrio parahaemolyticus TaxID=670 RepID=UPI00226B09B4|nr:hypothetical protein [Vibrio parahaemolyticus]MCX8941235.1 hypothetical protein [Vibrio parahaemolyticus]